MRRTLFAFVLGLAGSAGCSMCQHPYDYCGPAYGPGVESHHFLYRRGSILGGAGGDCGPEGCATPASEEMMGDDLQPMAVPAQEYMTPDVYTAPKAAPTYQPSPSYQPTPAYPSTR